MAEQQWRVPVRVVVGKFCFAVVLAVVAVIAAAEPWLQLVVALAVLGMVAWAVRDLLVPVRVAADETGLSLVTGLHRRLRVPWSQVRRVRVDVRRRSRLLEVDTDDTLYLFSRYEVDADLDEVAARLEQLRTAAAG